MPITRLLSVVSVTVKVTGPAVLLLTVNVACPDELVVTGAEIVAPVGVAETESVLPGT